MQRSKFSFLTILIVCFLKLPGQVLAALPLAPAMTSYVVDQAKLLKEPSSLAAKLKRIFEAGGPQIAVLTIEDLRGDSIESWSLSVARSWKLGRADKDDGVLIVIAKAERKVRVEVGYGLENRITPPISRDLIHQFMLPEFRVGNFQKGVEGAIYRALEEIPTESKFRQQIPQAWQLSPRAHSWKAGEPISVAMFFLILFLSIFRGSTRQTRGRRYTPVDGFDGEREYWSDNPSNTARVSSSSIGRGGSFGGGGASGSW